MGPESILTVFTAGNAYFMSQRNNVPKLDQIAMIVTAGLTIDACLTPLVMGGHTLQEVIGSGSPQEITNHAIQHYEKVMVGIGNTYLGVKELINYVKNA